VQVWLIGLDIDGRMHDSAQTKREAGDVFPNPVAVADKDHINLTDQSLFRQEHQVDEQQRGYDRQTLF
jgi:hypothetical protein